MKAEELISVAMTSWNWRREPRGLYEPIGYTLDAGGKRVRPVLAVLASRLFGGKDRDVLPAAVALEVFHNFTLLHDDLMDNSATRRGRQTVHVRWGTNTAVLSGDQMLIESYRLLEGVPSDKLAGVLRMFNTMATGICEGQQYDVDFETRSDVTVEDYLKMIRLKTSVLLANALQTGAYIAGAGEAEQRALYDFGICLGLAFQLQDDLLDVYGDPETFGKPVGGDICCNKKTYLLLTALQRSDASTRAELDRWLAARTFDRNEKIAAVRAIYNRLGVRDAGEAAVQEYTSRALAQLEQLPARSEREELRALANRLVNRQM